MSQLPRMVTFPGADGLPRERVISPCKKLARIGDPCPICAACPFFYRGIRCGPATQCTQAPTEAYVCTSFECLAGGPFAQNRVITVGGGICYQFGTTPIPASALPPAAVIFTSGNCAPDCTGCTLPSLYYGVRRCGCTNGPGTFSIVVPCDCYWAAKNAGVKCPVVSVLGPTGQTECFEVVPGVGLPSVPVGATVLCPTADGCCACCPTCFRYNGMIGSWICDPPPAPGQSGRGHISGPIVTCCCGDHFTLDGTIILEYREDGCVLNRKTWTFKSLGPCALGPIGNRGSLTFVTENRGVCGGPFSTTTEVEHCTESGCSPGSITVPIGGGQRVRLNTDSGLFCPDCLLLGCSTPTVQVTTSANLTCDRYSGTQLVAYVGTNVTTLLKFDVAVGAIEGDRCRGECTTISPGALYVPPSQSSRLVIADGVGGGVVVGVEAGGCGAPCGGGVGF